MTRLLLLLGCLPLVVVLGCNSATADQWPRWRGPLGNGTWVQAPRLGRFPRGGLPVLWRAEIGPGYSGVAVAAGRVYTMDRPPGSEEERVLCFSAATGRLLWQHRYRAPYGDLDYGKGPRAMPTIHDGRVYTLGAVGHFYCLDAATGRVLWHYDLERQYQARRPMWGFAASPVIYRDMVIVHAGLSSQGCYAAFERRTGRLLWQAGVDPAGYATPVVFRYRGRVGLLGWTPEHVMCLDPDSGRILWQVPYKVTYGVSIATPIVVGDLVFVSGYWEGGRAIRLGRSLAEAKLAWKENRYLRGLMSQPLYRDGYAYLLDKRHGLVCFELATGKRLWTDRNRLTPRERNPQATLVWLGQSDQILALNARGELVHARLTPQGYDELQRVPLVGETWAHPAYCDQSVFARDDRQLIRARLPVLPEENQRPEATE